MDKDYGRTRECKDTGIPLQYHPGSLPGPGGIAKDKNYGSTRECKVTGIPLQYHPGSLSRLGGFCANSIGHDKKRDDVYRPTSIDLIDDID